MSKVGVCRISFVFIIIAFTLSVIGYSQYKAQSDYPAEIKTITSYAIPGCLVVLYMLLLSSYILCIIIKPDKVPKQYNLTTAEIAQFMIQPNSQGSFQALATLTRDYVKARPEIKVRERDYRHGGLRICEICSIIKPDRSHHCAICKQCVMRMDHHCHWVNNCIHERNHKYFIQCITVAVMISLITILHYILTIIYTDCQVVPTSEDEAFPLCVSVYVASGLSALLGLFVIFLTLDHCTNLFRGQTSYERVYERDHYDRGWKKNFLEIMGQGLCEWVCPVASTKLSPEHEPLIVTVAEQSSAAWLATTDNRVNTVYETEESCVGGGDRHSTSSQDTDGRSVSPLDQFADETLSLQQTSIAQMDPNLVTRIRTPSTMGEQTSQ